MIREPGCQITVLSYSLPVPMTTTLGFVDAGASCSSRLDLACAWTCIARRTVSMQRLPNISCVLPHGKCEWQELCARQ